MRQSLITEYFALIKTKSKRKIQSLMTDYLESENICKPIVYGYNSETDSWHCLACGEDMGKTNPRQLCGKTYCYNKY
jgi:hypothetical protein